MNPQDPRLVPASLSPATLKAAPVACPRCSNRDRTLIEVSGTGVLYCVVCSKVWRGDDC